MTCGKHIRKLSGLHCRGLNGRWTAGSFPKWLKRWGGRWAARTYKLQGSYGIIRDLLLTSSGPSSWSLIYSEQQYPIRSLLHLRKEKPGYFMFYFGLSLYIAANILALVIAVKASS